LGTIVPSLVAMQDAILIIDMYIDLDPHCHDPNLYCTMICPWTWVCPPCWYWYHVYTSHHGCFFWRWYSLFSLGGPSLFGQSSLSPLLYHNIWVRNRDVLAIWISPNLTHQGAPIITLNFLIRVISVVIPGYITIPYIIHIVHPIISLDGLF